MKKIGILGGTFNPIHHGHCRLAIEALEQLHLDHVRFIPAYQVVHRVEPDIDATQRLQMVQKAIAHDPRLCVDDREIKRLGPSYMIDTLYSLKHDYPHDQFYLLLGADAYAHFSTWKSYDIIPSLATLVVTARPGTPMTALPAKVITLTYPMLDVSSTQLREALTQQHSIAHLTPHAVIEHIRTEHLYGY